MPALSAPPPRLCTALRAVLRALHTLSARSATRPTPEPSSTRLLAPCVLCQSRLREFQPSSNKLYQIPTRWPDANGADISSTARLGVPKVAICTGQVHKTYGLLDGGSIPTTKRKGGKLPPPRGDTWMKRTFGYFTVRPSLALRTRAWNGSPPLFVLPWPALRLRRLRFACPRCRLRLFGLYSSTRCATRSTHSHVALALRSAPEPSSTQLLAPCVGVRVGSSSPFV